MHIRWFDKKASKLQQKSIPYYWTDLGDFRDHALVTKRGGTCILGDSTKKRQNYSKKASPIIEPIWVIFEITPC